MRSLADAKIYWEAYQCLANDYDTLNPYPYNPITRRIEENQLSLQQQIAKMQRHRRIEENHLSRQQQIAKMQLFEIDPDKFDALEPSDVTSDPTVSLTQPK